MKAFIISGLVLLLTLGSSVSLAWVSSPDATIINIVMHEEGIDRDETILVFSDDNQKFNCHIKNSEKNLTSLALSLYVSGNKVTVHCHDTIKAIGSFEAHKLHRLISN